MPLEIIRNDITKVRADAIVNAANTSLLGGGGVDGAIHHAAGPELLEECRTLGGCRVGQAKITKGYMLPARYVIHTVGPIWQGGENNEEKLLADCYRNSLLLAEEYHLESVAFPLISAGAYGYPGNRVLHTAVQVIGEFLLSHDMTVYLVVFDKVSFGLSEKLFASIRQYIDDKYTEDHSFLRNRAIREDARKAIGKREVCFDKSPDYSMGAPSSEASAKKETSRDAAEKEMLFPQASLPFQRSTEAEAKEIEIPSFLKKHAQRSLDDVVKQLDETFSKRLLRLIDEKGMTDAETYKRANIDRKLFSKIRNDIHYKPSKPTVIAFAIALRLNLDETRDLLLKAGFALSHSSKFDLIIHYFIEEGNYNIFEINEALFAFDQNLLGI